MWIIVFLFFEIQKTTFSEGRLCTIILYKIGGQLIQFKDIQKGFLRHLNIAHFTHFFLSFFLFL